MLNLTPETNLGQAYRKWFERSSNIEHGKQAIHFYQTYLREVPQTPLVELITTTIRDLTAKITRIEARIRKGRAPVICENLPVPRS